MYTPRLEIRTTTSELRIGMTHDIALHSLGKLATCLPISDKLKLETVAPDNNEVAMRKTRFSEEPMVSTLRKMDRDLVEQADKRHGISDADDLRTKNFGGK